MTYTAAIDFGTSFTSAAARTPDGSRVITLGARGGAVPSVVFVREDGSMVFGDNALRLGQNEAGSMAQDLKRRIGGGNEITVGGRRYPIEELIAAFLRWILEGITEQEGAPPASVVFTHPASWNGLRIAGYREVIQSLELADPHLASEPYAVALHHAGDFPLAVGELIGVYDLGGGVFDAAVLRRTLGGIEMAGPAAGEEYLGGSDFDRLLASQVTAQLRSDGVQLDPARSDALLQESRMAKEALTTDHTVAVTTIVDGEHRNVEISRAQFEQLIAPSVAESLGTLHRAIRNAGVTTEDLAAVLLTGGSSVIPLVQRTLADSLPGSVDLLAGDRKHAVARGAAAVDLPFRHAPIDEMTIPAPPPAALSTRGPTPQLVGSSDDSTAPNEPDELNEPNDEPAPASVPAQPTRRVGSVVGLAAVAVIVAGLIGGFVWWPRSDGSTTDGDSQAVGPAQTDSSSREAGEGEDAQVQATTVSRLPSPAGMVQILGGPYTVGADRLGQDVASSREVELGGFWIDETEVPNTAYNVFLASADVPSPAAWPEGDLPDYLIDHPVRGVEWAWAETYCRARGKRLPTEAEWEAAGQGPAGEIYPWGPDPIPALNLPGSRPIGAVRANITAAGVRDAVGSAWEWVDEPYEPVAEGEHLRKGGQYGQVRHGVATRQSLSVGQSGVAETGFRCAADEVDPDRAPGTFNVDGSASDQPNQETDADGESSQEN